MGRLLGRLTLRVLHGSFFCGSLVDLVGADPVAVVLITVVFAVGQQAGVLVVLVGETMQDACCGRPGNRGG